MKKIIPSIFMLSVCLASCRKEEVIQECPQVGQAPQAFLNYWYFPEGSYWVYKQRGSVPAILDTVRAFSVKKRLFKPGENTFGLPTCVEIYECNFSHSNRSFFRGLSSLQNFTGFEHISSLYTGDEWGAQQATEAGNMYSPGLILSFPLPSPGTRLTAAGPMLLDTMAVTVPAGQFRHSLHFAISFRDSTTANFLRRYQLSRGIGYTRLVYTQLGTWELIAYKITP
ncbi:hypothetical protein [Hymenobacter sp. BT190]|uniref:hypothetical protein n=1 Tax=Hymenobacter sp. BT190 TaxID=2763505 RepID=UPI00165130B3|nr:hypothetical protein [Hymenobacter sp. BT190]MBC6700264.1 hypothetical protein [Hymenobacter sp. BT190]